jgi:alkanesulfonate monooxygenase SsuD/methylene tetrahydromethanopterin reductase-like flavin-dependent oxidoreductase (luciferase family)
LLFLRRPGQCAAVYRTTTERFLAPEIGVGCIAKPYQKPHPPILVTSIRPDSSGPYRAGMRGWDGISVSYVGIHVHRAHIRSYLARRATAGLSSDASGWRVARSIFVADDEATALRHAHDESGAHGFYLHVMHSKLARVRSLSVMADEPGASDIQLAPQPLLRSLVLTGTPDQVAERILALREQVGPFGTLLYTGHDWVDPALAARSMELMAREVWPRVLASLRD